jgi:hypothetical protein
MSDKPDDEEATKAGWQAILERAERWKSEHLASNEFIDLREAATQLGQPTAALDGRLLVLPPSPARSSPRVPIWALPLYGSITEALLANERDAWALYHFLTTGDGVFNGKRPLDLLPSHLPEVIELLQATSPPKYCEPFP